ncbi:MAG: lipopolysaccharide biosynthesis protein [Burkholderiales bacterium]|nr:MAG: lipopolysaccharide biosynthesis protein [Burkholderiales bacterium]
MNSTPTTASTNEAATSAAAHAADEFPVGAVFAALWQRRLLLVGAPLLASVVALGISYLITPTFSARVSFMPPQQQQSSAAGALASLGALAGLAGGGVRNNGDQYVALVQSVTVADRLVERFDLVNKYERKFKIDARKQLAENTRVTLGRKDGLITLEVDDHDPKTAADMATAYVEELRALTARLALTEAQQRRAFFEKQLGQVKERLTAAQLALSTSGVSLGALKAEPKAAADGVAKLKAELTTAEVKLQVLRRAMSDNAAEVIAMSTQVQALRGELARLAQNEAPANQSGYIAAYREFKYQEALFEQISRQYEIARIDESRDGGQLQLVDAAEVPERKTKPKRSYFMIAGFGLGFVACAIWVLVPVLRSRRPA